MKLPSFRRIIEQDYPEQYQELVKQLSVSLNYGLEVIYSLLNGKLTFADNIASTIKEVQVKLDSSGNLQTPVSITKSTSDKILGLMVVRVNNLTNPTIYPSGGVIVSYTETTSSIILNNIKGLQADYIWAINVIAIR